MSICSSHVLVSMSCWYSRFCGSMWAGRSQLGFHTADQRLDLCQLGSKAGLRFCQRAFQGGFHAELRLQLGLRTLEGAMQVSDRHLAGLQLLHVASDLRVQLPHLDDELGFSILPILLSHDLVLASPVTQDLG